MILPAVRTRKVFMADVFLSYRNIPDRRALVRRLAFILRAYGIEVWWDYGLEAGESWRNQIMTELANARVVAPLWCAESITSQWVRMEAELGKDKLVPARLQNVSPPDGFEAIQSADLIGWDGDAANPHVLAFVRRICKQLGREAIAPTDMIEELAQLRPVPALPEVTPVAVPAAPPAPPPTHDFAFWERQWEKHGAGDNLIALTGIAEDAPRFFANLARARIAAIEAAQAAALAAQAEERERQARERERELKERRARERELEKRRAAAEQFRAEGRIKVDAAIFHGDSGAAKGGWLKPGAGKSEWFKEYEHGTEVVVVPAGTFMMGSPASEPERESWQKDTESPQHSVTIAYPFAIARHAVTRGQFAAFVAATGHKTEGGAYVLKGVNWEHDLKASWRAPGFRQDDSHPVVCINFEDAMAFAAWLSRQTGKDYRLPTEAEWEYAGRAGTTTPFWWGPSITPAQANYDGNYIYAGGAKGEWRKATVPVGSFKPNPWGLYQVHGNAWAWCQDYWHDTYGGAPSDGSAWLDGGDADRRVIRGGSWDDDPRSLRSAYRYWNAAVFRNVYLGFRVGRTLTP
jgi:formylglycine-generating enzyme required for sulfatase activity